MVVVVVGCGATRVCGSVDRARPGRGRAGTRDPAASGLMSPSGRRLGALQHHMAAHAAQQQPPPRPPGSGPDGGGLIIGLGPDEREQLSLAGFRCGSQLRYLAGCLAARGERVHGASLRAEGLSQGVSLLKAGHNPYYRNALLSPYSDRQALLASSSPLLSAATNPPCLQNPEAPVLWEQAEWEAMRRRQAAHGLFDWEKVLSQFDRGAYERDGYCVLRGVMTPPTAARWAEGLRQCQRLNDRLLGADWRTQIDWEALGLQAPPPQQLSPEAIRKAMGTAQAIPQTVRLTNSF